MVNVSFYLLTPKAKNHSSLYVSLTTGNKRLRFPTGEKLPTEYCNYRKKKGKDLIKKNTALYFDLDRKLKDLKRLFYEIDIELQNKGKIPSPEEIKEEFFKRTNKLSKRDSVSFFSVFDKFISSDTIINNCNVNTLKIYNALKKHLENYQTKRNFTITFDSINLDFWEGMKSYYSKGLTFSNSSINKYLKRLKQIISYMQDEGYIEATVNLKKFKGFEELHTHDMPMVALSEEEMEVLYNLDLSSNEKLGRVRDLFLIECYTGQRYSDLESVLNPENIGKDSITIFQQKTNSRVSIPLTAKLREHLQKIVKRYEGKPIPVLSNQKFNDYLKDLGQLAEFNSTSKVLKLSGKEKIETTMQKWELITTHTGRRTFCTYALSRGIPAEVVMRVSGHKSYEVFRKYIRLDDKATTKEFNEKF